MFMQKKLINRACLRFRHDHCQALAGYSKLHLAKSVIKAARRPSCPSKQPSRHRPS